MISIYVCKDVSENGKMEANIDVKILSKTIEKKTKTRYNYNRQKLVLLMQCNTVNQQVISAQNRMESQKTCRNPGKYI